MSQPIAPPIDWTKLAKAGIGGSLRPGVRPTAEAPPTEACNALLDYYELLEGAASAADEALCRPGALAVKARLT